MSVKESVPAPDNPIGTTFDASPKVPTSHECLPKVGSNTPRQYGSGSSDLLSPGIGWRIARILVDREERVSAVVTVLSRSRRRGDFGLNFASGRNGRPDDLKPPIIAGPNVVIDRRRLAVGDHFLSGALGVVARREA